jgi:hypothetical protein
MPSRLKQVLPYAVMLVAAALIYWAATRIEADTGGRIGPAVWPKTIVAIMGLLCIYEIAKRLLARSTFSATGVVAGLNENPAEESASAAAGGPSEHPRKLAGGIALVAAYVVAAPWLGFFVSTALFLAIFPWVGGLRRPALSAAIGILGSLALIIVFMRIAYISLPLGEGPFRAVSLALLRALGVS